MHTVKEIEDAIERLPADEFRRLAHWVAEREQEQWDAQMNVDAAAGKLDFLIQEAEETRATGQLRDWPGE